MSKGDQSRFMSAAEQMKQDLGPALCLAKWKQVSFHLPTGLNNSCYHPPLHPIDATALADNPSALHNTEQKKHKKNRHNRKKIIKVVWVCTRKTISVE